MPLSTARYPCPQGHHKGTPQHAIRDISLTLGVRYMYLSETRPHWTKWHFTLCKFPQGLYYILVFSPTLHQLQLACDQLGTQPHFRKCWRRACYFGRVTVGYTHITQYTYTHISHYFRNHAMITDQWCLALQLLCPVLKPEFFCSRSGTTSDC